MPAWLARARFSSHIERMTDSKLPSLFVSHGSPTLALDPGAAGEFWRELAASLPRPKAILCISAHWNTRAPLIGAAAKPETIHDFYGFPEPMYRLTYPAPGAPLLAERALQLLRAAGIPAEPDPRYGLDHGAWVPLRSFYSAADIPVTQLSVQPSRDARWHLRLGAALAPLRDEGVLILASGGATHNLHEIDWSGGPPPSWAKEFDEWLASALAEGRTEDLLDWEIKAPHARRAHPSPEHFLPLFVGLGAAGENAHGTRLYQDFTMGGLSMAAFRFAA
jgi:4,5-DOPA dioxygenase extradiol